MARCEQPVTTNLTTGHNQLVLPLQGGGGDAEPNLVWGVPFRRSKKTIWGVGVQQLFHKGPQQYQL